VVLLSVVPGFEEAVAHRVTGSLVCTLVVKVKTSASKGILNMIDDGTLDRILILANVRAHQRPHLLICALLNCFELRTVQDLLFGTRFLQVEL